MVEKVKTSKSLNQKLAEACQSVMLEVISVLGPYRKHFVLVGGLVPKVLIDRQSKTGHVGTLDIDFAVNFHEISDDQYSTIAEMLFSHNYRYRKDKQGNDLKFSFERTVFIDDKEQIICVDLVGPQYGGKINKGFREKVQDGVHVHKARGIDLVFENPVSVEVTGYLPDGIKHSENIWVVNSAVFIIVKAITFESRKEPKDAYDIYYCLKNYPEGLTALGEELLTIKGNGLVKEGFKILNKLFSDSSAIGPQRAARFITDDEIERKIITINCSELVKQLLSIL